MVITIPHYLKLTKTVKCFAIYGRSYIIIFHAYMVDSTYKVHSATSFNTVAKCPSGLGDLERNYSVCTMGSMHNT